MTTEMQDQIASAIEVTLDNLAELQSRQDALHLAKQALIDGVITPEIKQQLADIECEFAPQEQTVAERITGTTADLKAAVLGLGATVKGARLMAVYSKPRVSWDTRALDGYAAGHPEILPFRKDGEPSVAIRKV